MGQKVNAIGFRLGLNKHWNSHWHAPMFSNEQGYIHILKEDFKISHYMKSTFRDASVMTHVQTIQRKSGHIQILLNMNLIHMKSLKKNTQTEYKEITELPPLTPTKVLHPEWFHIKFHDDTSLIPKVDPLMLSKINSFKSHPISFKWRRFFHDLHMQHYYHHHMMKDLTSIKMDMMTQTYDFLKPKMEYIEEELNLLKNPKMDYFMNKLSLSSYNQLKAKLFLSTYLLNQCHTFHNSWNDYKSFKALQYELLKKKPSSLKNAFILQKNMEHIKKDLNIFQDKFKGLYDSWKWFQNTWNKLQELNPSKVLLLNSLKFYKLNILKSKLNQYVHVLNELHILKNKSLKKLETISSSDSIFLTKMIQSMDQNDLNIVPMESMILKFMEVVKKNKFIIDDEFFKSYLSSLFYSFATYHFLHLHVFNSLRNFISTIYWIKYKFFYWKHLLKSYPGAYDFTPSIHSSHRKLVNSWTLKKRIFHHIYKKKILQTEKILHDGFNSLILKAQGHNKHLDLNLRRIKKRLRDKSKKKYLKRKKKYLTQMGLNHVLTQTSSNLQFMVPSQIRLILKRARKKYNIPYNIHYLAHHLITTLGSSKYKRRFPFLFRDLADKLSYVIAVLNQRKHRARKIKGFRMQYAGKLWSKGRAKKQAVGRGTIALQNISQLIHYEFIHKTTKYGVTGFKLWLNYYPLKHKVASSLNYEPYVYLHHQKHQLRSLKLFLTYMKDKLKKKIFHISKEQNIDKHIYLWKQF